MSDLSTVIQALEAGLAATPDDVPLRLQLARVRLSDGDAHGALDDYGRVLAVDPVHRDALEGAVLAAREAGETTRADAYSQILSSLGSAAPETPAPIAKTGSGPTAALAERPVEAPETRDANDDADDESGDEDADDEDAAPRLRVVDGGQSYQAEVERVAGGGLDRVAGLEDVKRRLELAFLGPIRNPGLTKAYGKRARGGLLLYGPPGCGKTHIGRALAGELGANFINVGMTDILDMYIGESEKNLHGVFVTARETAPTVLFFDELDAIGQKRSTRSSWTRQVVNQLLVELDGIGSGTESVYVVGATNLPWDVDAALRRPGRFDRTIFVPPPDLEARQRIIEIELEERPTHKVDPAKLAKQMDGFSGADVAYVCELATELALEAAMKTGDVSPISAKDFKRSLSEHRPSTASWFETARNHALFADAGGEFEDLVAYMKTYRKL